MLSSIMTHLQGGHVGHAHLHAQCIRSIDLFLRATLGVIEPVRCASHDCLAATRWAILFFIPFNVHNIEYYENICKILK
jgi:hypothetical protein